MNSQAINTSAVCELQGSDRVSKFKRAAEATEGLHSSVQQCKILGFGIGSVILVLVSLSSDRTLDAHTKGALTRLATSQECLSP